MAELPIASLLRHHAGRKAVDAVAVVHPEGALTWRELEGRANQRARLYQSAGVKAGDFVTIGLPNSNSYFEATFAVWKLGATPNIVSHKLPGGEAAAIVELARPSLIVAQSGDWPQGVKWLAGDADASDFDPSPFEEAPPAPYWKAMTSGGSTGRPKIIVDHRPAAFDPEGATLAQKDGVILNPGPLYHNAPFSSTHVGLFTGNKIVGMTRFDPEEALRLIEAHRVDWVNFVPTMMHRIWALPEETRNRYDVSSLLTVWHMASAAPAWLKEAWLRWIGPEKVWEMYGGTEGQGFTVINGVEWLEHRGSVGRLATPGRVRVLREDGSESAPGEVGEIYFLHDDGSASPYHYIGAEPRRREGGWESLGDMGRMDEDGYLYISDRRTDLILRGGANIYPAEIEAALDEHPSIASSLVVGLPHADLGRVVHAVVQTRDGSEPDIGDIHAFLRTRLVSYKIPESYEASLTSLRDEAGKARRSAIRDEREKWLGEGLEFRILP